MRLVHLDHLQPGDRLGRDVHPNPGSMPLLRAGVAVSAAYIGKLRQEGVTTVWVDDELSAGIHPPEVLRERTRARAHEVIMRTFDEASDALRQGRTLDPVTVRGLREVATLITADILASGEALVAITDLASADAYTLEHSLSVTLLGLLIGQRVIRRYGWVDAHGRRRFEAIDRQLSTLGVGLMLHDVGKLSVPPEVLQKPGALDDAEWRLMRAHPVAGWEMLRRSHVLSPISMGVVRSHHERWDGSGYPDGLAGARIPQFARIAAVADVYDAITSERPYRAAQPPHLGVAAIVDRVGADFDAEVVALFRRVVAPYPPGQTVALSDGARGVVESVEVDAFDRPVVRVVVDGSGRRVPPARVDLGAAPALTIVDAGVELLACRLAA